MKFKIVHGIEVDTSDKNCKGLYSANDKVIIEYYTIVKLLGGKKNPNQGKLKKLTLVKGILCGKETYTNHVKKNLLEEGKNVDDFTPNKLPWGERVGDSPIITHNDKTYIQVIIEDSIGSHYMLDGEKVDPETIEGFQYPSSPKKESQGGVENKVKIRTINQENILTITPI